MRAEPLRGRLGWGGSKGASGQEELWAAEAGGTSEMGLVRNRRPECQRRRPVCTPSTPAVCETVCRSTFPSQHPDEVGATAIPAIQRSRGSER